MLTCFMVELAISFARVDPTKARKVHVLSVMPLVEVAMAAHTLTAPHVHHLSN
jgi:hypothetical protein